MCSWVRLPEEESKCTKYFSAKDFSIKYNFSALIMVKNSSLRQYSKKCGHTYIVNNEITHSCTSVSSIKFFIKDSGTGILEKSV